MTVYTFEDLQQTIKLNDAMYDLSKIERSYQLAQKSHEGQLRRSGDPYISHPIAVAIILADLGMDTDSIVAALLHDVVEDTEVPLSQIEKDFGGDIGLLVDGVTKLGKIPFTSREEEQAENIRKMLMAMAQDVRVIIIKLADRLHNMRTIDFMPEQKQRDTALETMEVYAPIAHRLGIKTIKDELEELSFRYLDPVAIKEIESLLEVDKAERIAFLEAIKAKITQRLTEKYDNIFIDGRIKSVYSIYRKMYIQGRAFDELYDNYAIRIIVDTIPQCYNIFGEIHDMFHPIPNRFKDYISTPKANMYQSLHTTVIESSGIPFEVQIRTWEMHHTAEYGIAAHWKYKEGIRGKDTLEEKIMWVRQILETQKDSLDTGEIVSTIKSDLSTDEVFVFTPKGEVITLPQGSTIIDFAYAIHSEVGNRMTGAKVDGRMVSLDTQLQTGNIVSIITSNSPNQGPSRDWINIVKTSSTRNKIKSWFKKERKEENIIRGKADLEKELRRNSIILSGDNMEDFLLRIVRNQRLNSINELYASIGFGGIGLSKIMPKIKEIYIKHYKKLSDEEIKKQLEKTAVSNVTKGKKKASSGVIVEGLDGVLVKYSKCCNPVPGDPIIGYITRGFGVSVHKQDCINVQSTINDPDQKERWINCEWNTEAKGETFKSALDIFGKDRQGLLLDISIALNNMHIPVYSLYAREQPDNQTAIQIVLGTADLAQLRHISGILSKIDGIVKIERAIQ